MGLLGAFGYQPVSLDSVLEHYLRGAPLPPKAVLLTFDDGYRDNLENALPILRRHGYPAVLFVPIGFLDDTRPLPHEESLRLLGISNETVEWDELAELEAGGVRIESHGIGHKPLSELEPAEATREIALSKLRLEERLGREVEAFAFVKGSLADYRPEHASLVQQAGYKLAFTSVSGANSSDERPVPSAPLQRRALSGADVRARPRRSVRPDRRQGHGDRHPRAPRVQRRARHSFEMR